MPIRPVSDLPTRAASGSSRPGAPSSLNSLGETPSLTWCWREWAGRDCGCLKHAGFDGPLLVLRLLNVTFIAGAPVRSSGRQNPRRLDRLCQTVPDRDDTGRAANAGKSGRYGVEPAGVAQPAQSLHPEWTANGARRANGNPSHIPGLAAPTCAAPSTGASLCSTTSPKSISQRAELSALRRSSAGSILNAD